MLEDKVGIGVHIPSINASVSYRSTNGLSIHTAKLRNVPSIFTSNIMQVCRSRITENNLNLKICWIPSHRNIEDHDIADHLAKKALSNEVFHSTFRHTLLDVSDWVLSDAVNKWIKRIPFQTTGVVYHKTFPNGRPSSFSSLPICKDTVITRLGLVVFLTGIA